MKYPTIDKEKLDSINRGRFNNLYRTILKNIQFDNKENDLNLSKSDLELLAWNLATVIIIKPY